MRKGIQYIVLISLSIFIYSCSGKYDRNPGRAYAPDMYYSQAYDYYNETTKIDSAGGRWTKMPVNGTIAREQGMPTHLKEGDTLAANALVNPYLLLEADLDQGKRMYDIYCGICHGTTMKGNGPLFASGKYVAKPADLTSPAFVNMSAGRIYYTILYGKNAMGSYASQLDAKQRWQVIAYIKKVQSENGGTGASLISKEENVTEVSKDSTAGEKK